ncbi:MAG TPA: amidohydrolase family protein [Thermomicrobiaceae bacterium]|nr:amidohydrolase family protein [Thermomicrobiaceae bacterium]
MARLQLAIRRGEIVTGSQTVTADLGISGGKIVQIGGDFEAEREYDALGKLILPGVIDAHVHLTLAPGREQVEPHWVDDFTSGSAAAAAGGVTTVGNMCALAPGELPLEGLARYAELAARTAFVDVILHPILGEITPQVLEQIPLLLDHGHNSIKYFMSTPRFDAQVLGYLEATQRAGDSGLISLIHCEDYAILESATQRVVAGGATGFAQYPESRPVIAEVLATERAVAFAEATGAPVYIVHLSSERALAACVAAQARGLPVYVETRPFYLHLTRERFEEPDAAKYVGQPPLRESRDLDAIWAGIQQGVVNTVCTDHAPWSLAAKLAPEHTLARLRPGAENLQVMLPLLYSEGVRGGRISLARMVEVLSTNAAKLFGIYPSKGTIAPGSDADLVVFDPHLTRTIDGVMLRSNADYSVYEGWEVTGWPLLTLRRGEMLYQDGEVHGRPGSGEVLRRVATMPL